MVEWTVCRDKKEALTHMPKFSFAFEGVQSQNWRRQWHPTKYSCLENPMGGGAW